ncbi:hypothetical protein M404DRAFT_504953 [Pisolithus tinctorius Marx 270]|uniref:Uncharacterized protein n=1 Tax=Pisolithus tinctorius Marx 270 TaxID=870435 RepID=A0A0C3J9Y9_PISTI|nr:hypothetical protein M404DRAFT_504953 [Pisolithus tinctorius Marx 270]
MKVLGGADYWSDNVISSFQRVSSVRRAVIELFCSPLTCHEYLQRARWYSLKETEPLPCAHPGTRALDNVTDFDPCLDIYSLETEASNLMLIQLYVYPKSTNP